MNFGIWIDFSDLKEINKIRKRVNSDGLHRSDATTPRGLAASYACRAKRLRLLAGSGPALGPSSPASQAP
jgi:hypothetical protein